MQISFTPLNCKLIKLLFKLTVRSNKESTVDTEVQ